MEGERVAQVGTLYEVGLHELGVAILKEHARAAAVALVHAVTPLYRAEYIKESLAFIQGSGLEMTIDLFGMPVSPEHFRQTFYEWVEHKRQYPK